MSDNVTKKVYELEITGEDSVIGLKKAIEQLTSKLSELDKTSKEYIETLEKLTEYQERLKDVMDGVNETMDTFSETTEFIKDFTEGFVEGINDAIESTDTLDDSLVREASSMGELRQQIKGLQDKLVTLDSTSEDYSKTLSILTEKNIKYQSILSSTKKEVNAAEGSYNALSQELSALRRAWKESTDEMERAKLGEKIFEINGKLKELDASIGNYQRNVGNYTNSMTNVFGNPRKEIRALREQLANLTVGSKEYNAVLLKMADLTQQQRHFQDQLRFSSSNLEDILTNLTGVARGVAGGFSVMNSAMGLFGDESEDVQRAMLKTQQLMALVQGLSGLEGLKDRFVGLVDGMKGFTASLGLLNQDTKEFTETAEAAGGASANATGALNAQGGAATQAAESIRELSAAEKEYISGLEQQLAVRESGLKILEEEGLANSVYYEDAKQDIKVLKEKIENAKRGTAATKENTVATNASKTATDQLTVSEKKLNAEQSRGNKLLGLDNVLKRLDAKHTQQLAAGNTMAALSTKALSFALKGLKYALISTGIGAIIVAIGELIALLGKGLSSLWKMINPLEKVRDTLNTMTDEIERQNKMLDLNKKYWDALGMGTYKKASKELAELTKQQKLATLQYEIAVKSLGKKSEEAKTALENMNKVQESFQGLASDTIASIQKMITDIEETEKTKGMTEVEKGMMNVNRQFDEAIQFLEDLKTRLPLTAVLANNLLEKLNRTRETALNQVKEKETKKPTTTDALKKEREEADKLYKQLVDNYKKEEEKLKEKYEKEKKLLEKFHKDTTLLTKKYYEDLDKLLTARQKVEYDKWVAHLNSILNLEENGTEKYMKKQIENMKKIFSADFGAGVENPFEQFFKVEILDEFGSKAIEITDDIKETMKKLNLDPHNMEDIQAMIDKWHTDKKAIEDATKALEKYISEQKMLKFEAENTNISDEMEKTIEKIGLKYSEIQSESFKGFYSGLSPQKAREEMEERYSALKDGIDKEVELWKKASEDESLTLEDRNEAKKKYDDALIKQQNLVVNKTIESNNLMIQSYRNMADSLQSIASNMASIFGSVSDVILENAKAQLDANEISEDAYKKQFEKAKAFQIAQATINTIAGAVGAFMGITKDTGGWGIAAAAVQAAAVLAAGFAEIAKIKATNYETNGSSNNNSTTNTLALPSVMVGEPEYQQSLTNQDNIDTLANAIGDRLGDQKVILVESDVQYATNKSNKRKTEVTF